MFIVEGNKLKDYIRVKNPDTGVWEKATFKWVSKDSPDTPISKSTKEQLATQELENALITLQSVIEDAKQKAELFNLGIETKENLDRKIAEYKTAKADYDAKK